MHHVGTEKEQIAVDTTLYQRHASRVFAYVYRLVPVREDAEDVVLEVFIAALKRDNLSGLSPEQQAAWLQQVARNKAVDHYRRSLHLTLLPVEQAIDLIDRDLTPEQQALQHEVVERLHKTLAQLSPIEQQVVRLRFGNGLRFKEIAEILDRSEGSVRALLSRSLRRLRAIYTEEEVRK